MKSLLCAAAAAAMVVAGPAAAQSAPRSAATGAASVALQPPQGARNGLEIYAFRVGQADSMLIVGPGPERRTLLVDLGVSRHAPHAGTATARHVGQRVFEITGRRHIDYFLLTHFHSDHFGSSGFRQPTRANPNPRPGPTAGIVHLVETLGFTIGTVIDTGTLGTDFVRRSPDASDYVRRLARWEASGKIQDRVVPRFGTGQVQLGQGVNVDIVAFGGRYSDNEPSVHEQYERSHRGHYARIPPSENDLSIAFELSLGNFEFWTGGDLSGADGDGTSPLSGSGNGYTNVETPMVAHWRRIDRESDVEIYRANHHGARYSTTPQLLQALDPEYVVYSAHEGHRHPSRGAVERVAPTARQVATDIDPAAWGNGADFRAHGGRVLGEIQIFVAPDGSRYSINGEPFRSYSNAEERANRDVRPGS